MTDSTSPKSVHLLTLIAGPDGMVSAAEQGAASGVVAETVEHAVAQAIHRPSAKFRSSHDECDALRAALRGRTMLVQVRNGELCSLGLR